MPHLELTSLPLTDDVKRDLAARLTGILDDHVPGHAPARLTMTFTERRPESEARGGILLADGAPGDLYLRVSTPKLARKLRGRLAAALSEPLVELVERSDDPSADVVVGFETYDPRDVIVAERRRPRERGGASILPVIAGLALVAGVYVAVDRLAGAGGDPAVDHDATGEPRSPATIVAPGTTTEATASMSATHSPTAGEAVEAGQQDVRSSSSAARNDSH